MSWLRLGRFIAIVLISTGLGASAGCSSTPAASPGPQQGNQRAGQAPTSSEGAAQAAADAKEAVAPERASGFREVPRVEADRYLAVAANPAASEAAAAVLAEGGTAIDAMVAAQMMLTLVEPQSSGIGGGAFLLYWEAATDRLIAFDGRETAPAAATPERFLDPEGQPISFLDAIVGGRSVGVPGVVKMLEQAHAAHGKRPWASLFADAIDASENGFTISPRLSSSLERDPVPMSGAAAAYFRLPDGRPKPAGTLLKNPELAQTLRELAASGSKAFYEGALAQKIVDAVASAQNPGDLTTQDLADYKPVSRAALCRPYRKVEVCGFPPPTSGGTTVLSILGVLDEKTLDADPLSTKNAHLLIEAERLAYADRGRYIGDPDFIDVPLTGLLSEDYFRTRANLIEADRALEAPAFGLPTGAAAFAPDASPELPSTSHLVVVDAEGNVATMTTSVEFVFGSHVMVAGFLLNNQLTDFSFVPDEEGRPVANAVQAKKRPRSSMAPTLVFQKNAEGAREPVLAVGSPGGSRIIGYVAQTIVHVVDHGLHVQDAIELPRVLSRGKAVELERHARNEADVVRLEKELKALGHDVKVGELNSGISAVQWKDGKLHAGADPRREGVGVGQ